MSAQVSWAIEGARAAILTLAIGLAVTAGAVGLLEPTETRYAEIARAMNASGDYVTPRLNGIAHFHKPPLAYWLTAPGLALAGDTALGARLATVLACVLTLLFTARIAARAGAAPGATAWILGASFGLFVFGRALSADPFLMAAVAGFWAFAPGYGAWLAVAFGFLAKGPVVLLLSVAPVLAAAAWARDRSLLARLGPRAGWIVAALVALPWFVVLALGTPGLAGYWLGFQTIERVAGTAHERPGPFWYYGPVLLAGLVPWTALFVAGLGEAWRRRGEPFVRLILAWLIVPFVVFSLAGSKLPGYLLPALPAAAVIASLALGGARRWPLRATAGLLAALALANWIAGPRGFGVLLGLDDPGAAALPTFAHLASATLLYAAWRVWRGDVALAALLTALAWTSFASTVAPYDRMLGSPRALAELLAQQRGANEPVVLHARFNAGLPFYLGERVRLLDVPRETRFDDARTLERVFVTRDSLRVMTRDGRRVWLFGPEEAAGTLARDLALDYVAIARDRHGALGVLRADR